MRSAAVRDSDSAPTFVAVVVTGQTVGGERVLDAELQGERIPGLRMEQVLS